MRSVFPALHDRVLVTLLWVAFGLLGAMVLAATLGGSERTSSAAASEEVPPQFVFGATPAQ